MLLLQLQVSFFHNGYFKFDLILEHNPDSESNTLLILNEYRAPFKGLEVCVATAGSEHSTGLEKDGFLNGITYHCQR